MNKKEISLIRALSLVGAIGFIGLGGCTSEQTLNKETDRAYFEGWKIAEMECNKILHTTYDKLGVCRESLNSCEVDLNSCRNPK